MRKFNSKNFAALLLSLILIFPIKTWADLTVCAQGDCGNGNTFWIASTNGCSASSGYFMKTCDGKFYEVQCLQPISGLRKTNNQVGGEVSGFKVIPLNFTKESFQEIENLFSQGKNGSNRSLIQHSNDQVRIFHVDEISDMVNYILQEGTDKKVNQFIFLQFFDVFVQRAKKQPSQKIQEQVNFELALINGLLKYKNKLTLSSDRRFSIDTENKECSVYTNEVLIGSFKLPEIPKETELLIQAKKLLSQDLVIDDNSKVRGSISPNPASSNILLSIPKIVNQVTKIEIFNQTGNKVKETEIAPNTLSVQLEVENLLTGVYIVQYQYGKHISFQTLVVKH
jgi:hypothetical protein